MIDILLVLALLGVLVMLVQFVFRPIAAPVVGVSVRAGRQVTIGRMSFPDPDPIEEDKSFTVPLSSLATPGPEIVLSIVRTPAGPTEEVSIARRDLRTLEIDATTESKIVVYAGYRRGSRQRSIATPPKCIWCGDGIIVCGVSPKCR